MPTEVRRVTFREDKSRSGSSRSSTLKSDSGAGSSSTGSSFSGTIYPDRYNADPLYEVNALKQALAASVKEVDKWKAKAVNIEETLRKELGEATSRVTALENHCAEIEDDKSRLQREKTTLKDENKNLKSQVGSQKDEIEALKKKNDKLKKKDEKPPAATLSPDSSKPHRSGSKHSKDSDSDKEKSRLKERFVPRNENSSEANSSSQANSRATRNRRMSNASCYVEPYGQGAPRPSVVIPPSPITSGGRRLDGYVATSHTGYPAISNIQEPVYSNTPRSTVDRPSVHYQYHEAAMSPSNYEDGNYHAYPLPPRR